MNPRPRLAPGTIVRRLASPDESYAVVKNPETQSVYKFEEWEADILDLLDGTRDYEEMAVAFAARRPDMDVDAQAMVDYVEGLRRLDIIEKTEQERHLAMMDQVKTFRKKRFYDAENSTLFQILVPLFDPNAAMDRIIKWIRWWWSPWFVIPWLAVFAVVLGFLTYHWDLYWSSFWRVLDPSQNGAADWMVFLFLMFTTGMWHELGHGFTCKRYGGEVHKIGIMIFYMQPAFYCSVDDSYLFPNPYHRMYVAFGGSYFELMLCSLALPVWIFTPVEWWVHQWALIVILLSGLSLIAFNLNPLIKLDGYYVLLDLLDVPTLREDSFEYIGSLLKRGLLHMDVPRKPIPRRRRRIYLIYGICSMLYTAAIVVLVYKWMESYAVGWLGPIGYLAMAAAAAYAMRRQIRDAGRFARHVWLDKREFLTSRPGMAAAGLALLGLALLALVPRSATRIESSFVVEPGRRAAVRAPAEGIVRSVLVEEGAAVRPGDILAVMESPELAAMREAARSDMDLAQRLAAAARRSGDAAAERQALDRAREARSRRDLLEGRIASLRLAAPAGGIVSTPRLEDLSGRHLKEGDVFCNVDSLETVRLAASVPEIDIEEIGRGVPVRMLPAGRVGGTIEATVLSVAPVASEPAGAAAAPDIVRRAQRIRVLVEVENRGGALRPGMSGRVQFLASARSPAGKTWRHLRRWAASIVW